MDTEPGRSLEASEQVGEPLEGTVEGTTLRRALTDRGKLPPREAFAHAAAIARALAAAHGASPAVVHRDLSSENVVLLGASTVERGPGAASAPSLTPTLKLLNLGTAKTLEGTEAATSTPSRGTLQYMSPEQIDARPVGPASDLYALGLVAYEMLTGAPPFAGSAPRELLNKQCTEAPAPLPAEVLSAMPRGARELVDALLAKTPSDRPASAAEVAARFEAFARGEDVASVTAPLPLPEGVRARAPGRPSPPRTRDRHAARVDARRAGVAPRGPRDLRPPHRGGRRAGHARRGLGAAARARGRRLAHGRLTEPRRSRGRVVAWSRRVVRGEGGEAAEKSDAASDRTPRPPVDRDMKLRTTMIWATLGVCLSSAAATALPLPAAV
ncbi:hypothetical protein EON77_08655, partial [bacterium]